MITKHFSPKKFTCHNESAHYDLFVMKTLLSNFNFTLEEIGSLFGVSRQAIDNQLKKYSIQPKYSDSNWEVNSLPDKILNIFEEMVTNFQNRLTNGKYTALIGADFDKNEFVLLYKDLKSNALPKCLFNNNIPENLKQLLLTKNFQFVTKHDLKRIVEFQNMESDVLRRKAMKVEKIYHTLVNRGYAKSFTNFLNDFDISEFTKLKELNPNGYLIPDKEIFNLLLTHYSKENDCVKIPIQSANYRRIINLASSRGYTIKTFVEHYGFKYKRFNNKSSFIKNRMELLKTYTVSKDGIYIPKDDKTYDLLKGEANYFGYSLEQYILKDFNLHLLEYFEVPRGHRVAGWYDYKPKLVSEDDFKFYINDFLVVEKNKTTIFYQDKSYFGKKIKALANELRLTEEHLLGSWGYKRVFNLNQPLISTALKVGKNMSPSPCFKEKGEVIIRDNITFKEHIQFDKFSNKELGNSNDNMYLLKVLDDLKREISCESNWINVGVLTNLSIKALKKLYSNNCQLCHDGESHEILINNSEKLLQIHNIYSGEDFVSSEDKTAFNYHEHVVVCNYHHNYLNLHLGGFFEIDELIDGVYFVNDVSEIKITSNKHIYI